MALCGLVVAGVVLFPSLFCLLQGCIYILYTYQHSSNIVRWFVLHENFDFFLINNLVLLGSFWIGLLGSPKVVIFSWDNTNLIQCYSVFMLSLVDPGIVCTQFHVDAHYHQV